MEKKSKESDSSKAKSMHEKQIPIVVNYGVHGSTPQTQKPSFQSNYITTRHYAYCLLTEEGEPSTFQEEINGSNASQWMITIHKEMEDLHRNNTCELVKLPKGWKSI